MITEPVPQGYSGRKEKSFKRPQRGGRKNPLQKKRNAHSRGSVGRAQTLGKLTRSEPDGGPLHSLRGRENGTSEMLRRGADL